MNRLQRRNWIRDGMEAIIRAKAERINPQEEDDPAQKKKQTLPVPAPERVSRMSGPNVDRCIMNIILMRT